MAFMNILSQSATYKRYHIFVFAQKFTIPSCIQIIDSFKRKTEIVYTRFSTINLFEHETNLLLL